MPRTIYKEKVEFPVNEESEWIEDMRRQYVWSSKNYTYSSNKSKKPTTIYLMFRVNAPIDTLSIDAIHLRNSDWIFACSASSIRGQSRIW